MLEAEIEKYEHILKTDGTNSVNWDRVEGRWKQQRGKAARVWGEKAKDELAEVSGRYCELAGKLQENYGIAREKARRQAASFQMQCRICRVRAAAQRDNYRQKIKKLEKALSEAKKNHRKTLRSKSTARIETRSHRIGSFQLNGGKNV